jgi:ribosomal protein L11 methyltransferase
MKDSYIELSVKTKEEFVDILADFIGNFTNEAVEIGSNCVILRTNEDTLPLEAELKELGKTIELEVSKEEKENIDWIKMYQDSVQPIDVAQFWVYPSWYEPKSDKINILINPALAFGSGHHATTYSCLQKISEIVKSEDTLLDVGCGSGILALGAAKKGAVVELCDTDPLAVDSAKENFELNNQSFSDIWVGSANKSDKKYDIVVANIIADVLKMIAPELKNRIKSDGILIVSGILDTKENIVTDSFLDLEMIDRVQKDEWVTITYKGK